MPPENDTDIGNFIDALLEALEQLAALEQVYNHNEGLKRSPEERQLALYLAAESLFCDFEHKTGVTATGLLAKWNKASGI